jgi:hypothetical protein
MYVTLEYNGRVMRLELSPDGTLPTAIINGKWSESLDSEQVDQVNFLMTNREKLWNNEWYPQLRSGGG